ncbi:cyclopropane-fatty-acyl-phospholipid synthase [Mycobacterium sp. 852002-50816_SCH5313054-b]|uniref:SAM-dependent methyltransferase n=1 Tax=Mycobacterium sp. 852002-50816_SCH5313054-b TaxID=1834092 RepID=UPI0008024632|nr:cyclopropane-fatty-acyl-phospholipid synthase family protein [Mycobacterium sp. 852002-50816_SCH5313054-b]OBF55317.1 cyclopropane-fatty-acyl-phospholipid synthase [Mycobacterium sp. 852002-50816_SCH5313054-b]
MTQTPTYEGASPAAIQHHYDVGNDFYALWLDPTLCYSSALWDGDNDTLLAAQTRKLDFIAAGARARQAHRVLDIGCGWGALLRRLIDNYGVQQAVGLTLSEAQASHIGRDEHDRIDVRVQNWIDHRPETTYDAIVSVGAFEHFADMGMSRTQRVEAYREFFARCADWLPLGGRLALETTIKGNNTRMSRSTVRDLLFIIDRIFPESEIPWLSEIIEASERRFELVEIRNSPHDYARTCREWHRRLLANRDRATDLAGPEVFVDYGRYLDASADAFDKRHLGLAWLILERI